MVIWFIFYILELFFVSLSYITTDSKSKKTLYSFSALIAIYFSAFRDGLGTDYRGYTSQMASTFFDSNSEPLFNLIKYIVLNTSFSATLFFALCAIMTIWWIWKYLDNKHNEFAALSIIIFLSLPGLYFNTFNVVRQYFAAGLFLYSLRYIQSKQFARYAMCIVVACLMHTSSLVLLPLYYVLNRKFSVKTYIIFAAILIGLGFLLEPIFDLISAFSKYGTYLDNEKEAGGSTITTLCLLIIILYFSISKFSHHKRYHEESPYTVMTINMFILYTILSVMVFVNPLFSRLSLFFCVSLCVMFPFVFYEVLRNKVLVSILCLCFSFIYFFSFIISGENNPEICPEKILPISSLFDVSLI